MIEVFLLTILSQTAGTPDTFDTFFTEFARKRDGVHALQARFVQETVVPDETLESKGEIVYARPRRLVFRYAHPEPSWLIDGQRAYEYAPDIRQLDIYDLEGNSQTEAFFLGFDEDTSRLQEAYDIAVDVPPGEPEGARRIVLKPKPNDDEIYFEKVTLLLRPEDYLPYKIHIINDAESHVTIRISDFAVNAKLDAGQAQIELPEGTAIIEGDRKVETVGPGGKRVPPQTLPLLIPNKTPDDDKAQTP